MDVVRFHFAPGPLTHSHQVRFHFAQGRSGETPRNAGGQASSWGGVGGVCQRRLHHPCPNSLARRRSGGIRPCPFALGGRSSLCDPSCVVTQGNTTFKHERIKNVMKNHQHTAWFIWFRVNTVTHVSFGDRTCVRYNPQGKNMNVCKICCVASRTPVFFCCRIILLCLAADAANRQRVPKCEILNCSFD